MRVLSAWGCTNPSPRATALGDATEAQCGQANGGSVLAATQALLVRGRRLSSRALRLAVGGCAEPPGP